MGDEGLEQTANFPGNIGYAGCALPPALPLGAKTAPESTLERARNLAAELASEIDRLKAAMRGDDLDEITAAAHQVQQVRRCLAELAGAE